MIYRGYTIEHDSKAERGDGTGGAGFYWTDERNFEHGAFTSEEAAMDAVDRYKRNIRNGAEAKD